MSESNLALVKDFLTLRYLNNSEEASQSPQERMEALISDFDVAIKRIQTTVPCNIWVASQQTARTLVIFDRLRMQQLSKELRPEEIAGIIDICLHNHYGNKCLTLNWQDIEVIQKASINQGAQLCQIDQNFFPDSLWIEINGNPPAGLPGWIKKSVGIFLTKIPLGEDRIKLIHAIDDLPQWKHSLSMIKALCDIGSECIGYTAIVAQRENSGFRFVPTVFGHEKLETVKELISLHNDDTQRKKFKEIERFATNLCIRAILLGETAPTHIRHTT